MQILEERTLAGLHELLANLLLDLPHSTPVLDLGCGSGAWLARLRGLGFTNLWGIDAGPPPAVDGLQFFQCDLDTERPKLERKFGLITLIEVIEHLANPGTALSLVSDYLLDDGLVLITTPNIHSLRCRLKFLLTGKLASFDEKGDPTHTTPLLLPGFRKIAARAGLDVIRSWTYPETGSLIFGIPIRSLAWLIRPFAPDPYPGDTLCITLKRGGVRRSATRG